MADPSPPSRPLDTLWQASTLIWTLLAGEGLAVILALAPSVEGNRWIYFGTASLVVQWILLLTLGILYMLRRRLAPWRPAYIANFALVMLVLATWLVLGTGLWVLRDLWPMGGEAQGWFIARMTVLAATVGALGLAAFQNHWQARQMAVRAKQSELESLQARIRPHFLFNTLNTGAALVHQRPDEAERLLLDLADLFRAALSGPAEIPLEDELALARRYLEIEALRFGQRMQVEWTLPPAMPSLGIPALSVQPLVENAVRHGIEPAPRGGLIEIAVEDHAADVRIMVRNTLPPALSAVKGHQLGLASARARLHASTRGRGSLLATRDETHYTVTVTLPKAPPAGTPQATTR